MIAAQLQKLATRVDALQLRERIMLLIVGIVFLYFLADSMGFQPLFEKQQLLLQDIEAQELQLEVLRARSSHLQNEPINQSSIPREKLTQELGSFGQKLKVRLDSMLSPDKATAVLEQVMIHDEGLTLNAIKTRQIPLISVEPDTGRSVTIDDINRYELKLQLEGGYLETLNYLRALEQLPWKFFWSGITFAITEYPTASVDLEIYTLGHTGN